MAREFHSLCRRAGVMLILGASSVLAQHLPLQPVNLRFMDSSTGYALQPQELVVYDLAENRIAASPEPGGVTPEGSASLVLPPGNYLLEAGAAGYAPITARLVVGEETPEQIRLFLDPLHPPAELEPARIHAFQRPGATLICGFVVDDASGRPLEGVQVLSALNSLPATSGGNGYFQLYLPAEEVAGSLRFEKAGYVSEERVGVELWPGGDRQYRIRLSPGQGIRVVKEGKLDRAPGEHSENPPGDEPCEDCGSPPQRSGAGQRLPLQSPENPAGAFPTPALLPNSIRLGRNCPGPTTCATVEVYTLQTYCKYVLPAEWYSCWGSLSNGMNSLQAGATAIRSYGVWHVYNPLTANYDICDNTFCQFFGSSQTSNGNAAVDATERYVLITAANAIARSEYSAENNNTGCGDGWSGTGTTWPCIWDPVCSTLPSNGHGRGMCQWGSARWATGTKIISPPCSLGVPHGYGAKNWQEILIHYYPDYQLIQGYAASIATAAAIPSTVSPGQTFAIQYTIQAAPAMSLMLGASVRPSAGGNWIDDPANDRKLSVNAGSSNVFRNFTLPGNAPPGSYDMWLALWYDVNGNNQINAGDFVFDSKRFNQAFTVGPNAVEPLAGEIPAAYFLGQNYPNPFNPFTTIEFSLPRPGRAALKIYDALGQEVASLVNETLPAGRYRAEWDAGDFPAGVYFYRLKVLEGETDYVETKRLVLVR